MDNLIIICVLAIILGLAIFYIYKSKKNSKKCIGCPDSGKCSSGCCMNCGGCGNHKS